MAEETLAPEVVEQLRRRLLQEHPEMEGATVSVALRSRPADAAAVAAKVGLPAVELPEEPHYVVTLRKDVQAEDGTILPLIIRVTVDAQGRELKRREGH